jgi:hypothetical protein
MPVKKKQAPTRVGCDCLRCLHSWVPKRCPSCDDPNWWRERVYKGRQPAAEKPSIEVSPLDRAHQDQERPTAAPAASALSPHVVAALIRAMPEGQQMQVFERLEKLGVKL